MSQPIRVYALSTCIHCKRLKEYLDQSGVAYEPTHVDLLTGQERSDVMDEVKKLNPAQSFPTLIIGETIIVGFKKDEIEAALGIK